MFAGGGHQCQQCLGAVSRPGEREEGPGGRQRRTWAGEELLAVSERTGRSGGGVRVMKGPVQGLTGRTENLYRNQEDIAKLSGSTAQQDEQGASPVKKMSLTVTHMSDACIQSKR